DSVCRLLYGWGDIVKNRKNFFKELNRQIKAMDKRMEPLLRQLCTDHYLNSHGKTDKKYQLTSNNLNLTSAAWEANKKAFEKDGWKRYSTGIAKVLKTWEKINGDWEADNADILRQGTWRARHNQLKKKFEVLSTATDKGFNHPGFSKYHDDMMVQLEKIYSKFKKVCDRVNLAKQSDGWVPKNLNSIPFSERAWKSMKEDAKKHLWDDKSPDIRKSFAAYEKARPMWNEQVHSTDAEKRKKAKEASDKALGKLVLEFGKFHPKEKKTKKDHSGMIAYKTKMLEKAGDLTILLDDDLALIGI
ncbi:MAG: hypothetical protein O7G85_10225, partial [Planctomycetota bacterium]|nr:hypothetical protein [Planctomycetota bacterium]